MNDIKFFLTLELIKGNDVFIDISLLDIAKGYFPKTLEEIDAFTMHFTTKEIKDAIDRANIADGYLDGMLCITCLKNKKHETKKALTKDFINDFDIIKYLESIKDNKNLISNFVNKYMSYVANDKKEKMKEAMKNNDLNKMYNLFNELPYLKKRDFLVYLINQSNI